MGERDATAVQELQQGSPGKDAEVRKLSSTAADARDAILDGKLFENEESRAGNGGE